MGAGGRVGICKPGVVRHRASKLENARIIDFVEIGHIAPPVARGRDVKPQIPARRL